MKAQMKFQKWMCLVMIIVGALGLLYSFCYLSGAMAQLGHSQNLLTVNKKHVSAFTPGKDMYGALLYDDIQGFNTLLMYLGIVMVLLAVLLYITACHKRRNYYVTNYVAIGVCAGGNIVMSLVAMIMNALWRAKFLQVDFKAWKQIYIDNPSFTEHYSDSTLWFDLGFVVYAIIIVASVLLILNLVWKVLLMKGEKKLLSNENLAGGVV